MILAMSHLKGLSGAGVRLRQDSGRLLVRKTAANPAGNDRLKRQAMKQQAYLLRGGTLATPVLNGEGKCDCDGRFFFEMDYVSGQDGHRFLSNCSFAELKLLLDQLSGFLRSTCNTPPLVQAPFSCWFDAAMNKLLEVQSRTNALPDAVLGKLFVAVGRLRNCRPQCPGFCHGDLTLENLMVDRDKKAWLVDFLDSPFEHPWQDYVKLQQDIEGGWYFRKGLRMGPAIMTYARQWLLEIITELAPEYLRYAPTLAAINFTRILPYTRTLEERAFVVERVAHFATLAV